MKKNSKILLASTLCLSLFGAVACSDDDSSTSASLRIFDHKVAFTNDGDIIDWDGTFKSFDSVEDLPACDLNKSIAQVIDEKTFYGCYKGKWGVADLVYPSYEELPECDAAMNEFNVGVVKENSNTRYEEWGYTCKEGKWVHGNDDNAGSHATIRIDAK